MTGGVTAAAVVFVLSVGALWVGAELFVTNAARVARRLGLSELVVGLTVVAMGTSAPEVAVSVDAARLGNGDLAVANVVGSNLFNVGLVLGGIGVATGVRGWRPMIRRDGAVMVGSTGLALFLLPDLRLGRLDGVVLLGSLAAYLALLFLRPDPTASDADADPDAPITWRTPLLLLGSNVFNALLIPGLAATAAPVRVAGTALGPVTWLLGLSALTAVLLGTQGRLGRTEGAALVTLHLGRWVLDLL